MLYSGFTHALLQVYLYFVECLLTFYSGCTHNILQVYSHLTSSLLVLYSGLTHTLFWVASHFTPVCSYFSLRALSFTLCVLTPFSSFYWHLTPGSHLIYSGFTHTCLQFYSQVTPCVPTPYSWFYLQLTPGFTHSLLKVYSHFTPGLLTLCSPFCSHFTPGLHTLHFGFTLMLEMEMSAQPCWMLTLW